MIAVEDPAQPYSPAEGDKPHFSASNRENWSGQGWWCGDGDPRAGFVLDQLQYHLFIDGIPR